MHMQICADRRPPTNMIEKPLESSRHQIAKTYLLQFFEDLEASQSNQSFTLPSAKNSNNQNKANNHSHCSILELNAHMFCWCIRTVHRLILKH